jgi:hypothetical protein
MTSTVKVYVRLKDEGTECWRPVDAKEEGASVFRILSVQPKEEIWEFPAGSAVRCKKRQFASGAALAAVERVA